MIGLLRQGSQLLLGLPVTTGTEIATQVDEKPASGTCAAVRSPEYLDEPEPDFWTTIGASLWCGSLFKGR
jgi:hypothetical protein